MSFVWCYNAGRVCDTVNSILAGTRITGNNNNAILLVLYLITHLFVYVFHVRLCVNVMGSVTWPGTVDDLISGQFTDPTTLQVAG